jgi:Cysteine-rich CPCC
MMLACPGCGFRTISEGFYGTYDICPVCGWEDDAVQLANPCSGGGANKESLADCQKRSATWSSEQMRAFERDPDWRPLSEAEIAYFTSIATKKLWTFMGETAPEFAYWRKTPNTALEPTPTAP